MRRLGWVLMLVIALVWCWVLPAQAVSEKNITLLRDYFTKQGTIIHELFTPLGGPELGGAVVKDGAGTFRLIVARVAGPKSIAVVHEETIADPGNQPPFTFIFTGLHLLTYPTRDWVDDRGQTHRRGDMRIYGLVEEGEPQVLFELKDVTDLSFQSGGAYSLENLIWQPSAHFLNQSSVLPHKYDYFLLRFDTTKNKYDITHHLTALPDAATNPWANLNNRAILHYRQNRLYSASRLLEQAAVVADAEQSIVFRNQAYVNSELDDLAAQGRLMPDQYFDEGLLHFWEGDYPAVLRVMEGRQRSGFSDVDLAVLGLSLAQEKRWPEADGVTVELERRKAPYLADFLYELVLIAREQGFADIAETRLLALEQIAPKHPGLITELAGILSRSNQLAQAQSLLEDYLRTNRSSPADLTPPRLALYDMCLRQGELEECALLEQDALKGPVVNLLGYVHLKDYIDLSSSLADVVELRDRIKAPDKPLDEYFDAPPGFTTE